MNTENAQVLDEVNAALAAERTSVEKRSEERLSAATKEREKISRLGSLLRYVGVAVLIAAMGTFMFQRWDDMTHMSRYFTFLAFTAGVCVSGLLCGLSIGESKGARTLLGAVVALIPVHCAQIGAMLYSRVGLGVVEGNYPSYFYLTVPSLSDAIIVTVGGVVALIPMAYMAYSVLARNYAQRLMLMGCGVSAVLLVPTRDPSLVAGLLAIAGTCAYLGERSLTRIVELKTREAAVARSVPFIALMLMAGRQCGLYHPTDFFNGVIMALFSAVMFGIFPRLIGGQVLTWTCEIIALVAAGVASIQIGSGVIEGFGLTNSILFPLIVGIPLMGVYARMGRRARETRSLFRGASTLTLFMTGAVELLSGNGVEASLVALVIGIIGITYACIYELKGPLFTGASLTLLSLISVCDLAIKSVSLSPWLLLGIIGVGTIVGASYLERNFVRVRDSFSAMRKQVAEWN